ncbi:MAG TPA: hypothetical protein VGM66_04725 [Candidatus Udaeobacter sp.]
MKRFSWWAFIVVALLHFLVSSYFVGGAIGASYAQERGVPDHSVAWTAALWIWDTVPMLLVPYFQPLRSIHILCLLVPWSLVVGACGGFLLPRLWRLRRQIA